MSKYNGLLSLLSFTIILSSAVIFFTVEAENNTLGLCCLCKDCELTVPGRGIVFVNDRGMTCDKLAVEMADPENGSKMGNNDCATLQAKHRDRCCNETAQAAWIEQNPTPAPNYDLDPGTEPHCDLCPDGGEPGIGHTVVAMLYMNGVNTCDKLYWMGQFGHIPEMLCNPLQDFSKCERFYSY